jgi:secreted PhoX family phosphatase
MKFLAAAAVLPLYLLASSDNASMPTWQFMDLSTPANDQERSILRTTPYVYDNQQKSSRKLNYRRLIVTNESYGQERFGQLKDYQGKTLTFESGQPYICNGTNKGVGAGPDHVSILQQDDRLFMVMQLECSIGTMYGMELSQDPKNGELTVVEGSLRHIDQSNGFGGWMHCAGSTTPWQSHLGSEEYEPDARYIETYLDPETLMTGHQGYDEVTRYFWNDHGDANKAHDNNPYYYGWIPEVRVDASASLPVYRYTKHFSMGRASWEMAYVMPDRKTVYLSDDGSNVGFYLYIADKYENLSAGTLYAARWMQQSSEGTGKARIEWIRLGHASDEQIREYVASGMRFSEIFDTEEPSTDGSCPTEGFSFVRTAAGEECLKVREDREHHAAFLETRRYAALKGATTEFRKEEGITFDADTRRLYVAMSQISKGMSDDKGHVRLPKNRCGAVYAMDLDDHGTKAYDTAGRAIASEYVVGNMYGLVAGVPASFESASPYASYRCEPDAIANPDNITYLQGEGLLVIGEDTYHHPNDFVWAYDTRHDTLTRIASLPYGAEATSPYWYRDINGWGYLTLVTQHPFGEIDVTQRESTLQAPEKESSIGVIGPFRFQSAE